MRKTMICQVQLLFQFFKDINTNGDQIFRKKFEFKHFITTIRKLPYKEFVIFNLKLKDHQLQVNSFIKSNFP